MEISVIICTHNPREDYLRRTLQALQAQTLSKVQWELLLIDNASKEPLCKKWDLSWHPNTRHIREDEVGLTPARLRGIRESKGELIVFVDDDNVLADNYLEEACRIARDFPCLGCFGAGLIEPEFEVEPSEELRPFTKCLALRSVHSDHWSNSMEDAIFPWGAGLVVQHIVAEQYLEIVRNCPIRRQLGRSGEALNSGEDDEFSWVSCDLGLGKGLFLVLKITHLIPRRRVEKDYLLAIVQGHGYSQTLLARLRGQDNCSIAEPSSLSAVIRSLFCAKISMTLYHANTWWSSRRQSPIKTAFDNAWRSGMKLGEKKLLEMNRFIR